MQRTPKIRFPHERKIRGLCVRLGNLVNFDFQTTNNSLTSRTETSPKCVAYHRPLKRRHRVRH